MIAQVIALVFGTFVSEDLTAVTGGLLVHRGEMSLLTATLACAVGIYAGDLGLWLVGRTLGARVLNWPRVAAILPPDGAQRFAEWFDHHGAIAVVGSRFTPGTRLPLYLAAGATRSSLRIFAGWSLVAVGMWTPALVGLSAALGERVGTWLAVERTVAVATALTALVCWRVTVKASTKRGRQQLAVSVARVWRWEFWPMWLFYAPVAAWTAWLALRHRGYRTITAANPGMPDGGVVGESKFQILSHIPSEWTVPSAIVKPAPDHARLEQLQAYLHSRGWEMPLIFKPDVGQRGSGVRLVRDLRQAAEYFRAETRAVLVQPYHPGPFEAGIFYYRMPDAPRGRILCITDKHFPSVVGDGCSTLEDLIWAHRRYRMQARTFLARLRARRTTIPAAGERVSLGIAGNHAQGAMFTDGHRLITPALEARIDAIAREYDGFFIGRFDVRYRDRESFMAGRDLAIVELNGATAECTNIYDPSRSLASAYRQLFIQWRLVFTIGAVNRRRGRSVSSPSRLACLVRGHLTSSPPFPVSD